MNCTSIRLPIPEHTFQNPAIIDWELFVRCLTAFTRLYHGMTHAEDGGFTVFQIALIKYANSAETR